MKKLPFLILLLLLFSPVVNSQVQTKQDSLRMVQDSIHYLHEKIKELKDLEFSLQDTSAARERRKYYDFGDGLQEDTSSTMDRGVRKAEKIIGSLFGESRQLSNADSLLRVFDNQPSFGMYKDNYIVTGTELFRKSDEWNSDCKFQVSVRQRLTNSVLPFRTHIFLTYTQKAYWDIYRESFPFRDINYNPTIGVGRPLVRNNRLLGFIGLEFEHESNGKDEDASRSWNKVSLGATLVFRDRWILQSKLWAPIVDGDNNSDIVQYSGYGFMALTYSSLKKKYNVSCVVTNRSGGFLNANVMLNFSVRMFSNEDIYFYVEYYDGYGESMLDYKEYRQRIRAGISIKTNLLSIY